MQSMFSGRSFAHLAHRRASLTLQQHGRRPPPSSWPRCCWAPVCPGAAPRSANSSPAAGPTASPAAKASVARRPWVSIPAGMAEVSPNNWRMSRSPPPRSSPRHASTVPLWPRLVSSAPTTRSAPQAFALQMWTTPSGAVIEPAATRPASAARSTGRAAPVLPLLRSAPKSPVRPTTSAVTSRRPLPPERAPKRERARAARTVPSTGHRQRVAVKPAIATGRAARCPRPSRAPATRIAPVRLVVPRLAAPASAARSLAPLAKSARRTAPAASSNRSAPMAKSGARARATSCALPANG